MSSGADSRVEAPGLARLAELFAAAPEIAREEVRRALEEAGLYLAGEIADRTPTHHGELARSFLAEKPVDTPLGVSTRIGSPLDYAAPVELGSKPHMPPVAPLVDWARSKLGLSPAEAKGVAWRIAWKIKHHGTEGAFMVRDAVAAGQHTLGAIFDAAATRIVERLQHG